MRKEPEDGIFFSKEEFFSTLKGQAVNNDDYENSKKLFILLKMQNLSDLNDLYNAQDVILLLEIIENRFQEMQNECGYNPRKVNSASKLSDCIQREQSKIILALPTDNEQMETFGKTLSGGFSCVNTKLSLDSEILMPNLTEKDFQKMNTDQSFKAYKRDDLKRIYKIKLDNQENYSKKRVITKILKFDENNQYGFGMTKPMPTGCIKEKELPSWLDFHILLETVDLDDSIGHLFIVDMMKKTLTKSNCSTMKFFHQSLKNRKLLEQMKDLHINFLNYKIKIKINQNHTDVLLNLMPLCFQKTLFRSTWKIFD